MELSSLYRHCIFRVANLLKTDWGQATWPHSSEPGHGNPFCYLPTSIIQDLVSTILTMNKAETIKINDLYHLLSSGQVEELSLDDVNVRCDDLVAIFMTLSTACQKLRSLILRNVYILDHYSSLHNDKSLLKKSSLECLLSISPRLQYLESCIDFNLKSIRNCEYLRVLKLNFIPQNKLCDFLERTDEFNEDFWPNNSLEVLEVFEEFRHPIDSEDLLPILKYCRALKNTNADVSMALESLHFAEMFSGTLSTVYKLEKCCLGNSLVPLGATSRQAVHIATFTCPYVKELDVLVSDHEAICALRNFEQLSSLLIQWDSANFGDFQPGVGILLHEVGQKLKQLHLINFSFVDFAAIGQHCPDLEVLKVDFQNELIACIPLGSCFKHLTRLIIDNMDSVFDCSEKTILMLLSHCPELVTLHLDCARTLTDAVLQEVFRHNSLSEVKDCVILECCLTHVGVLKLISQMKSLEYLHFSSSMIDFDDAASIVHDVNPFVIMRSVFD